MGKLGFYFDMNRCIGCRTCQIACKERNKLPTDLFFRRVCTQTAETGAGDVAFNYSGACNHCSDPACVNACPTGAMHFAEDGTVVHEDSRCIGCGRCVHSCPYGAVTINEVTGYAAKCDGCASLRAQGQPPACVLACPTRALRFGDLDALEEELGKGVRGAVRFLPPAAQTKPSLVIANAPEALLSPEGEPERGQQAADGEAEIRKDTNETLVILGGGPAAVTAAEEFRKYNKTASIVMFTLEKELPYCRPLLSKALLRGFTDKTYRMVDQQWLQDNRVELRMGNPVLLLDPDNHCVIPRDGAAVFYDKCIYALGADCFVPPIPGTEKGGVLTVRKLQDLEQVRRARLGVRSAAVIGGGFIGLETAWQLQKAGLQVTILEAADSLMGRLIDEQTARVLKERICSAGIEVITGTGISAICGEEHAEYVALSDGRNIPAELVIVSTGVRANVGIAREAGLQIGRAVTVNEKMETSVEDVYACGDCCEYRGMNSATWVESIQQGRIAGANAAGNARTYHDEASSIVVHTAGAALYAVGDLGKNTDGPYEIVCGSLPGLAHRFRVNEGHIEKHTHFSACFKEEKLVGMTLVGDLGYLRMARDSIGREKEAVLRELNAGGAKIDA